MRLVNLYQVLDTQAETVIGPIFAHNNYVPIARELVQHLEDKKSMIGQAPQDFVLILIGQQDLDTGRITPVDRPTVAFKIQDLLPQGTAGPASAGETATGPRGPARSK